MKENKCVFCKGTGFSKVGKICSCITKKSEDEFADEFIDVFGSVFGNIFKDVNKSKQKGKAKA